MNEIKFYKEEKIPIEMHRTRIVQKINLLPIDKRIEKINEAGNNTFLLQNKDIFLDMLTDSGVNAMSNIMQSAMLRADDSYAGSETYNRMSQKIKEIFNMEYFLPAHQGRACENILTTHYIDKNSIIPMNVIFDSFKDFLENCGANYVELYKEESINVESKDLFKGDFNLNKLNDTIEKFGASKIPFVRIETGGNLLGGQPISVSNIYGVHEICKKNKILLVLDASLLQDNLYFIKNREPEYKNKSIREIARVIASLVDIIYFSGRKFGFGRGGGMCVRDKKIFNDLKRYIPMYEGFLTYGGMSVGEMEALTVGFDESMDETIISQGPLFIEYMVKRLKSYGIPVVTPNGGLGVHIDAKSFLPHIPLEEYPAGSLAVALYICSGIRCMERGTLSESRKNNGDENFSKMELIRIALPRRVFTLSQIIYAIDRIKWLYDNKDLINGLSFYDEPQNLRFYFGKLKPINDWQLKLKNKFLVDFEDSL